VQKLIAYDHLEGDPGLENGKNAQLFADILNMVCGCVGNSTFDRFCNIKFLLFSSMCSLTFLLFYLSLNIIG
jgi:hypothetical protein